MRPLSPHRGSPGSDRHLPALRRDENANPLSICIITKNEEMRIAACIGAIRGISTDIVVVDSGSEDNTVALAAAAGARVFTRPWEGYGPQKRFAEDCAQHDWVLNLDADEIATSQLCLEIAELLKTPPPYPGYRIRIRNVYPGEERPRLWADYNNYVRLYDRRRIRFRTSPFHDTVDTKGERVGQLKGAIVHHSAHSFAHIRRKLDAYSTLQAQSMRKSIFALIARIPIEYPATFLKFYLMRRHFTGGWPGILSSHLAAEARFNRLFKLLRAHRSSSRTS